MLMTDKIVSPMDSVNKKYVDESLARAFFAPVDCTPGVNVALSGTGTPPIWDGVQTANASRVFLSAQTAKEENGVYVMEATGGSWELKRASDADKPDLYLPGKAVAVKKGGSLYGSTIWVQTSTAPANFTNPVTFEGMIRDTEAGQMATVVNFTTDGTNTEFTTTHTLGTKNVVMNVYGPDNRTSQTPAEIVDETTIKFTVDPVMESGKTFTAILVSAQAVVTNNGQGIYSASATKSGTTFLLTVAGLPSPAPSFFTVQFITPAMYGAGDDIQIDGETYECKTVVNDAPPAGHFASGVLVNVDIDSARKLAFFRLGGASKVGASTLNIFTGTTDTPPAGKNDGVYVQTTVDATGFVIGTTVAVSGVAGGVWGKEKNAPILIMNPAVESYGNYDYILGGLHANDVFPGRCYKFNKTTREFETLTNDLPVNMTQPKSVRVNDRIFVWDLYMGKGSTGYILDTTSEAWTQIVTPLPAWCQNGWVAKWTDDKIVLGGFQNEAALNSGPGPNTYVYSISADTYTQGITLKVSRYQCAAVIDNNDLYLLGGTVGSWTVENYSNYNTNQVDKYDLNTGIKSDFPSMNNGYDAAGAAIIDGNLIVAGYNNGDVFGEYSSLVSRQWVNAIDLPKKMYGSVSVTEGGISVLTNYSVEQHPESIKAGVSTEFKAPVPYRSQVHTCTVGTKLCTLGGYGNNGEMRSVAVVDIVTKKGQTFNFPNNIQYQNYGSDRNWICALGSNKMLYCIPYSRWDNATFKTFIEFYALNLDSGEWETVWQMDQSEWTINPIPDINSIQGCISYGSTKFVLNVYQYVNSKYRMFLLFDTADNTVKEIPELPVGSNNYNKQYGRMAISGNLLYILLGQDSDDQTMPNAPGKKVWAADISLTTPVWTAKPDMPDNIRQLMQRYNMMIAIDSTGMYMYSGQNTNNGLGYSTKVYKYTFAGDVWGEYTDVAYVRMYGSMGVYNNELILMFGNIYPYSEFWRYEFTGDTSIYPDGTIVIKQGLGKNIKLLDDGINTLNIDVLSVWQTIAGKEEHLEAQVNVNGTGWETLD